MLLPFLGRTATEAKADQVLTILVSKGNAKEVFLKCNEALKKIEWQPQDDADEYDDGEATVAETLQAVSKLEEGQEDINPVRQMVALCRATDTGSFALRLC
jgi:hypothetical protein